MQSASTARIVRLLLAATLIVSACESSTGGGGGSTGGGGGSVETADPAFAFGESQLNLLLGGASAPPSILTWEDVLTGKRLSATQSTAFCSALGVQGADNAISSILAAGLSFLSLRLRKQPVSSESKELIGVATTFATMTCPAWDPTRRPIATPAPILAWYPSGFRPQILQPDVAWRWAAPRTYVCDGVNPCYGLDVAARGGCPGYLRGTIATKDENGVVLEFIADSKVGFVGDTTTLVFDLTNPNSSDASVIAVSCDEL